MKRYTINIGDEFPLNDERPGARSRRWGLALRALFVLAIAAIIFSHPFQAALLLGLALLVRRSGLFAEARTWWRQNAGARQGAWQARAEQARSCGARWNDRRAESKPGRDEDRDRYKAFV